jgi:hypothetical protein
MGVNDCVVFADASISTFRINLPTAVDGKNTFYDIKRIDANASTVVSIEGSGVECPVILNTALRPSVTMYSDGISFWII